MKYDNVPRKSDMVNWTAYFKISKQVSSKEVVTFAMTYLNPNSSIKVEKTNIDKLDEILSRSFGQVLFVHQLHHIYCELFDLQTDNSHVKCIDYFFGNDKLSIESDFNDRLQFKYGLSSEFALNVAKHLTRHEFKGLPSYDECIKEVEPIIDSNFKLKLL
jgi:hypothetical protein